MVGNTTSSPEPSHQHTLKYSLEKQTFLLPLTVDFSPVKLQKDGQRLKTSKPGVQSGKGGLSVEKRPFLHWQIN